MINENKKKNEPKVVIHPLMCFAFKLWLVNLSIGILAICVVYIFHWEIINSIIFYSVLIFIIIIIMIIAFIYSRTMRFEIFSNEVVEKKGVINRAEKHVSYRTVTNISTRYGIFDKLFKIGTVEIETAGKAGRLSEPEEKIEGISNFVDLRNTVLEELRKFRSQYTTATEPDLKPTEDAISTLILNELRSNKCLLQNQAK